jgi:hypothetical protein
MTARETEIKELTALIEKQALDIARFNAELDRLQSVFVVLPRPNLAPTKSKEASPLREKGTSS